MSFYILEDNATDRVFELLEQDVFSDDEVSIWAMGDVRVPAHHHLAPVPKDLLLVESTCTKLHLIDERIRSQEVREDLDLVWQKWIACHCEWSLVWAERAQSRGGAR